ncbi:MAG TPA: hypothetical protein VN971_03340 [Thermoanaerobaculia bacterium]|nr:hypothetical protein [Thermoanaerobaculia bacterium]
MPPILMTNRVFFFSRVHAGREEAGTDSGGRSGTGTRIGFEDMLNSFAPKFRARRGNLNLHYWTTSGKRA